MVATVLVTTTGVLPAFLTGAAAVQIRADLGIRVAHMGWAFVSFYLISALCSAVLGRVVERIGAVWSMRAAAIGSATTLTAVATLAHSPRSLFVVLAFGGVTNAMTQPASNLYITSIVPPGRLGMAFAIKQSAIPGSTLLGGLAVPTIALTIGWRWAFVVGAGLALVGAGLSVRNDTVPVPRRTTPARRDQPMSVLVVLGAAIGLGAIAASGLGAFATSSFVEADFSEAAAGWFAAAGSAAVIVTRLFLGRWADRQPQRHFFGPTALMLCVGALGWMAMGLMAQVPLLVGAFVGYAAGWGWPGLFNLSIAQANPDAPAAASGVTQTGTYLGAGFGPLMFGAVADRVGYGTSWRIAAACALVSAGLMVLGQRRLIAVQQPA